MFQAMLGEAGWQPDIPDPRDLVPGENRVVELLRDLPALAERPAHVDWRQFCPAVGPPDRIPSSIHACVDLLAHCERQVLGQRLPLSKLFVFRTASRLAKLHGVQPQSLRNIWKALVRFGAPPQQVWPGSDGSAESDPDTFAYFAAQNCSSLLYVRLDAREQAATDTLDTVRWFLAAGFGVVFGFPLCSAITENGEIGFPTVYDVIRGGHAVLSVGYDDQRRMRSDRGCLLVRSCWGSDWGENGYGWLPYRYVCERLTSDFWTIIHPQWLESGEFKRPW